MDFHKPGEGFDSGSAFALRECVYGLVAEICGALYWAEVVGNAAALHGKFRAETAHPLGIFSDCDGFIARERSL